MSSKTLAQLRWLLSVRHAFRFDGKPDADVAFRRSATDGLTLFYRVDTHGPKNTDLTTRHPNIYRTLVRTKGSINLHIKMYAEDLATGALLSEQFEEICRDINAPDWFRKAVERQKSHYI
jgi:hypothetical protein